MACWHLMSVLVQVTVAVVCCVVLHISFTSLADFDVGCVWVRRTEV